MNKSVSKELSNEISKMKSEGYAGVSVFVGQNKDATKDNLAQGVLEHLKDLNDPSFTHCEENL
jgi:dihydroorotase-like cyclic amidohydrolase